jgi:hypothetical protein
MQFYIAIRSNNIYGAHITVLSHVVFLAFHLTVLSRVVLFVVSEKKAPLSRKR